MIPYLAGWDGFQTLLRRCNVRSRQNFRSTHLKTVCHENMYSPLEPAVETHFRSSPLIPAPPARSRSSPLLLLIPAPPRLFPLVLLTHTHACFPHRSPHSPCHLLSLFLTLLLYSPLVLPSM